MVERAINPLGMYLRPQPSVNNPFLKPDRLQCSGRNFTKQRRNMWPTKSAKAVLCGIAGVGIAIVEGRAKSGEYQEAVKVSLEKNINVHPTTDVPSVSHVARSGIECICRLIKPALHSKPGVEIRHVVDARRGCFDPLIEIVRAEVALLVEKLRQVWTSIVAGSQSTKQSCRRYSTASFGALEVRTVKTDVGSRGIRYRVRLILGKRHVAQQRHPVILRNLRRLFPAGKGGSRRLHQRVPVWSFHVEGEARLRIC